MLAAHVHATLVTDYTLFGAVLDTDADPVTGGYDGAERQVIVALNPDGSIRLTGARVWGEPRFIPGVAISATSLRDGVSFSFSRGALGIGKAFRFYVYTLNVSAAGEFVGGDVAPDTGLRPGWTYRLTGGAAVVRPVIGAPRATPVRPVSGKRFTVVFPVTASDTGAPLRATSAACTTKVAGKTVAHTHTVANGALKAALVIPKTAKGKQLKIAAKVTANGQTATKIVTYKIR